MTSTKNMYVTVDESRRFICDAIKACNTTEKHANEMADLIVAADHRGHFSHGLNRLPVYINDLENGVIDGSAVPEILASTPATAWVDAKGALGAVAGNFCMGLAMEKARTVGVGIVSVRNATHFGIAGWYTMQAQNEGLIGMAMTNASPLVTPTRSKNSALGTNPISFAAPVSHGHNDGFVLDMATSAVAFGKIEIHKREENPCPVGWALDGDGEVTTDANVAFKSGRLMPLGGQEETSGYKGYGLAAMVELLCGVLAGANFATNVRNWTHSGLVVNPNLGQFFMAIDPKCFAPGFSDRAMEMNDILRNLTAVNADKPVLVPGDAERINMAKVDKIGGILYHENQIDICNKLATRLGIRQVETFSVNSSSLVNQ